MSRDWVKDIIGQDAHYGMGSATVREKDEAWRTEFLAFRINFLNEELSELIEAALSTDAEGVVDALIDIVVVAIGTLTAFGVDAHRAWDEVLRANMSKEAGVNPNRPNPLGLPDLRKPQGWIPPSHEGNHGLLFDAAP